MRWRLILPVLAIAWFGIGSYSAWRFNRQLDGSCPARYFYWGSIRLDSDPLDRHHVFESSVPCNNGRKDCPCWEPVVWIDPGWAGEAFIVLSLPAFLLTKVVSGTLAQFGVSKVTMFFASMPILMCAWFYVLGLWIDRLRTKRQVKLA